MRIKKLTLHGVGPFKHTEIEFREGSDPKLADVTLIVGENGTGKSTILYAIAAALGAGGRELGVEHLSPRFWAKDTSFVQLDTDAEAVKVVATETIGAHPFAEIRRRGALALVDPRFPHVARSGKQRFDDLAQNAESTLDWAAFAYAGVRSVGPVRISSIEDVRQNPTAEALSFTATSDAQRFAQWLASLNYYRLQAREQADARGAPYQSIIERVERSMSEVLGEPISFVFPLGDLNVRVRLRGSDVEFDVLPEGLKSVLSWLGDTLMRLNRISWAFGLPIEEREFLLLLDEVDVHLHPAWQRRVLPLAQRLFPKAQIIATTHSPLVVASAADAHVVVLRRGANGSPSVDDLASQLGSSYSAVLRSIFGVESEFDKDTEAELERLHELKRSLLQDPTSDRSQFDSLAAQLGGRSEELGQIVAYEKRQLDRQLKTQKS